MLTGGYSVGLEGNRTMGHFGRDQISNYALFLGQ